MYLLEKNLHIDIDIYRNNQSVCDKQIFDKGAKTIQCSEKSNILTNCTEKLSHI